MEDSPEVKNGGSKEENLKSFVIKIVNEINIID